MVVDALQRLGDVHVARCRFEVHIGCRTARNLVDALEGGVADPDVFFEPMVILPGLDAVDIDIAAKAHGVDGLADDLFKFADGGEIDDGEQFERCVGV